MARILLPLFLEIIEYKHNIEISPIYILVDYTFEIAQMQYKI